VSAVPKGPSAPNLRGVQFSTCPLADHHIDEDRRGNCELFICPIGQRDQVDRRCTNPVGDEEEHDWQR
jgi:hypothetical protein